MGDFFGGADTKKEDSNIKEESHPVSEVTHLQLDCSKILNQMLVEALERHDVFHALFIIRENKEFIDPQDSKQLQYLKMITSRIINEIVTSGISPQETITQFLDFMLGQDDSSNKPVQCAKNFLKRSIEEETIILLEQLSSTSSVKNLGGNCLMRFELEMRLEARQNLIAQQYENEFQLP
jgi:hypothetical protein